MRILARDVIDAAAAEFGVSVEALTGPETLHPISRRRALTSRAIRTLCPHVSYPAIGAMLGGRHHTTILKNVQHLDRALSREPALIDAYARLILRMADTLGTPR